MRRVTAVISMTCIATGLLLAAQSQTVFGAPLGDPVVEKTVRSPFSEATVAVYFGKVWVHRSDIYPGRDEPVVIEKTFPDFQQPEMDEIESLIFQLETAIDANLDKVAAECKSCEVYYFSSVRDGKHAFYVDQYAEGREELKPIEAWKLQLEVDSIFKRYQRVR
jgi:hypothetical protein